MPEMQSPNRKVNKQAATSPRSSSPSMIRAMTEGPVASQLLRFALPLFVSNALQAVYNLVDMIIVGNFIGKTGLSAVSIGGDILHLLTFVAMGFSSAGQVIIARAVGAGRYDDVKKTIGTMFSFLLGIYALYRSIMLQSEIESIDRFTNISLYTAIAAIVFHLVILFTGILAAIN